MVARDAVAGPLKSSKPSRHGGADGKDKVMWVFDGEEWTQDNGGVEQSSTRKPEPARPLWPAEMVPELQIIEIVPQPVREKNIVPFPMP